MADYSLGTAHGTIKIDSDTTGITQTEKALAGVDQTAGRTGQSLDKTGNQMGVAGLVIAGGLALATKTAGDFEFQLSAIKAVSGATAPEMDKIRDAALRIGKDTQYSASEAASAIEELAKAGIPLEDILNGAADATVNLAAAGGVDLPTAATIASNAMNQFGLTAEDMVGTVDTIAQVANASAIDVTDLGMSMSQVGAVANLAGFSLQDTAIAIGQLGDAGIKGSDAGTSLKTMLSNLQPTTEAQSKAMSELGLITEDGANAFYNADGSVKSLREIQDVLYNSTKDLTAQQKQMALETIFGSDAIRAAAVMADGGAASYDEFSKKMTDVGSAADVAKTRQDNMKGSLEQLKGSAETFAIQLGTLLIPAVRQLIDFFTKLLEWFMNLDDSTKKIILIIAGLAGGLLLLGAGIIKTVAFFKSLHSALISLRIMSSATQASFIKTAGTAVVSAARTAAAWVASAATTVALWAMYAAEAAINGVKAAAAWVASSAAQVASWVAAGVGAVVNAAIVAGAWVVSAGTAAATAVAQTAVAVASMVAQWVVIGVQSMIQAVKVAAAWVVAMGPVGWAIAAIAAVVALVIIYWDEIVAAFRAAGEWIAEIMGNIWEWIQQAWDNVVGAFVAAGQAIWDVMTQIGEWIWGAIQAYIGFWVGLAKGIWDAMQAAWHFIVDIWNTIISFISSIPGKIIGFFSNALSWLVNAGRNMLVGLINGVVGFFGNVWSSLTSLVNGIFSFFGQAGTWLLNVGKNLVTGLWNGISGAAGWLWDKVAGFAGDIVDNVLGFFGIHSPSKLFAWVGEQLTLGLSVGVEDNASKAIDSVYAMAEGMSAAVGLSSGGSDAFWDATALGTGYVPPSNEVTSYAASQGESATSGPSTVVNTTINNPVAEKASDSEARRLRTLSALGAF